MTLAEALRRSEWFKARTTVEQVTTIVQVVTTGYDVAYRDQQKHFTTMSALEVFFLGDEILHSTWEPIQERNE